MGFCMNCGRKLPSVAVFCPKCGTKVEVPTCPACGTEVEADADFCLHCGTRLNEPVQPAPAPASAPAQPDPAPASAPVPPAPAPTPRSAPASGLESAFEEKPRKKWPTYVAIALTLCIVVATIALGLYTKNRIEGDALEKSLAATWNAYYMEVDDGMVSRQSLKNGEVRLLLRQNNTFRFSTNQSSLGNSDIHGIWSCPDGKTLALDYGHGRVVKMSVEVGSGLLYTRGTDGEVETYIKWSKK